MELLHINLSISIDIAQLEDSVHLRFAQLAAADHGRAHLLLADQAVAVDVHLLEDGRGSLLALHGLADLEDDRRGRGTHHSYELLNIDFSIVVGVSDTEDCRHLLLAETSGGHFLLADFSVSVLVQSLEALFDLLEVAVGLAETTDHCGRGGAHHSHELGQTDGSVIVDVSDGENGLNLLGIELVATSSHLLHGDISIPVLVQYSEELLGVIDVVHIPGQSGQSHPSHGAEQTNELLQVDFSVAVEVAEHEDRLNLLSIELSACSELLFAEETIPVHINSQESFLHLGDVLE